MSTWVSGINLRTKRWTHSAPSQNTALKWLWESPRLLECTQWPEPYQGDLWKRRHMNIPQLWGRSDAESCFIWIFKRVYWEGSRDLRSARRRASSELAPSPPAQPRWAPGQTRGTWCWKISPSQYQHQSQLQLLWGIKVETCYQLLKTRAGFGSRRYDSGSKDRWSGHHLQAAPLHCILFLRNGKMMVP